MVIRNLTVKIEYRMKAGHGDPRWKALRGRVMVTHRGRAVNYGVDLFPPNLTSVDAAIASALLALPHVETVHFVFDELMGLPDRSYLHGGLLPPGLV